MSCSKPCPAPRRLCWYVPAMTQAHWVMWELVCFPAPPIPPTSPSQQSKGHFTSLPGQDLLKLLGGRHAAGLQQVRASSAISTRGADHQTASTKSCRSCCLQTFTIPYNPVNSSVASWAWLAANPWAWGPAQDGCLGESSLPRRRCSRCPSQQCSYRCPSPPLPIYAAVGSQEQLPLAALPLPRALLSIPELVKR